ncbi:MAG: hypothetical protein ACRYHB_00790, partial [Janthinobacterium lividum]
MNATVVRSTLKLVLLLGTSQVSAATMQAQDSQEQVAEHSSQPQRLVAADDPISSPSKADAQNGGMQAANAGTPTDPDLHGNFFRRLVEFYGKDWTGTSAATATPARRALDAPLDAPPFPNSDWGYGGSPMIGVPDTNVYPLMNALKLQNHRTKIYGWIAPSANF